MKVLVVLRGCAHIRHGRIQCCVSSVEGSTSRPFFQCGKPYLKEKELTGAFCAKWCGFCLFLILQGKSWALQKLYLGKIDATQVGAQA